MQKNKRISLNSEFAVHLECGTDYNSRKDKKAHMQYWTEIFRQSDYDFVGLDENPQLYFSAFPDTDTDVYDFCFGKYSRSFKVCFTEESFVPHPAFWDSRFSVFSGTRSQDFHIICCAVYDGFEELVSGSFSTASMSCRSSPKDRFCNFVYKDVSSERLSFFEKFSGYKRVDAPGRVCNNMEPLFDFNKTTGRYRYWVASPEANELKNNFIKHYKFTLAIENRSTPGYITEKLLHPLVVGSIPIYWGDPSAAKYFNPDSFINSHDFKNLDEVVEYVKKVDQDEALYQKYREAPAILPDSLCHGMTKERVTEKLKQILETIDQSGDKITPVSRQSANRFVRIPFHTGKAVCTRWARRLLAKSRGRD